MSQLETQVKDLTLALQQLIDQSVAVADLTALTAGLQDDDVIVVNIDSSGQTLKAKVSDLKLAIIELDGSGTTNFVTKWIDSDTVGDSVIFDDGTNVGIGIINPNVKLDVDGNVNATTFLGDLSGTINTITTAVTKINATNDTTLATTAFVQNLLTTIPSGLVFQGTWNASTNTPTLTSGTGTTGHFYIVSVDGTTNLDGITDWKVGDWAVFVEQGASDQWQKVDNSSVLDGAGTGDQLTKWSGSGTSNTLTDSIITDNGTNVGIGVTNPSYKLQVDSGFEETIAFFKSTDNRGRISIGDDDTTTYVIAEDDKMSLGRNASLSTGNLTIDSAGNVGIGTTNPATDLVIANGTSGQGIEFVSGTTSTMQAYDRTGGAYINLNIDSLGSRIRSVAETTFNNGAGFAESMRITSTGNVGIGTTNPSVPLEVYNDSTTTLPLLRVKQDGTGNASIGFNTIGSTQYSMGIDNSDGDKFKISRDQDLSITTRLTIDSTGNVGIGTTSPIGGLHVANDGDGIWVSDIYEGVTASDSSYLKQSGDTTYLVNKNSGSLRLGTNNFNNMFTVAPTGNVGIGTTNPNAKLDVFGDIKLRDNDSILLGTGGIMKIFNDGATSVIRSQGEPLNIDANGINFRGYSPYNNLMTILESGNVGIGTTNPDFELEVAGNIGIDGKIYHNTDHDTYIGFESNDIKLRTGGSDVITINSSQNVGIGTTTPTSKLHVFEAGTSMITVDSGATAPYKAGIEFLRSSSNGGSIYNDGGAVQIKFDSYFAYDSANPSRGGFQFRTAPVSNNTMVDAVRIDGLGRVGIGTSSPNAKLDVNGDVFINSNYTANASAQDLTIGKTTTGNHGLTIVAGPTYTGSIYFGDSGNNDRGVIGYQHSDNSMKFKTNRSEAMRIDSAGNVGIGTTNPSAKLEVDGGAKISNNLTLGETSDGGIVRFARGGDGVVSSKIGYDGTENFNLSYLNFGGGGYHTFLTNDGTIQERMRITNTGNVGIGTTNPVASLQIGSAVSTSSEKLDVRGNSSDNYVASFEQDNITGYGLLIDTDATLVSEPVLKIKNKYSELFYVGSNGNVGIGTTNPSNKLSLELSEATTTQSSFKGLVLSNTDTTVSNGVAISFSNTASSSNSHSKIGAIYNDRTGGSEDTSLFFGTLGGGAYGERMRIDSAGNVGIGTTTPSTKLHVVASGGNNQLTLERTGASAGKAVLAGVLDGFMVMSDIYATKLYVGTAGTYDGNVGIGTATPSRELEVQGVGNVYVKVKASTDSDSSALELTNTAETWTVRNDSTNDDSLNFESDAGSQVTMLRAGNVGIGTTTPNAKLEVVGYIASNNNVGAPTSGANINMAYGGGSGYLTSYDYTNSVYKPLYLRGSETIINQGNVGIGTTNPNAKLAVKQDGISWGDGIRLEASASTNYWEHIVDGSNNLNLGYNGSTKVLFDDNGNVGIGTTSPSAKLEVAGDGIFTGNVGIGVTNPLSALDVEGDIELSGVIKGRGSDWTYYSIPDANSFYPHLFYTRTNSGASLLRAKIGGGSLVGSTEFTNNNFSVNSTQLYVRESDGNVGIGTATPSAKLDVRGNYSQRPDSNTAAVWSLLDTGGTVRARFDLASGGSSNLFLRKGDGTYTTNINSDGDSYFNGGNVGIGTTSPSRKLEVSDGFISTTNPGANGGFELKRDGLNTYQLRHIDGGLSVFNATDSRKEMSFDGAGNVGIGTSSPGKTLQVGDGTVDSAIRTAYSDGSYVDIHGFGLYMSRTDSYIRPVADKSQNLYIGSDANTWNDIHYNANVHLFENDTNESMRITTSGAVGIGTTTPEALLDISSTTNGVLLPRMTTTQVNAIPSPSTGLTVYNTTLNTLCFYNGTSWQKLNHATM